MLRNKRNVLIGTALSLIIALISLFNMTPVNVSAKTSRLFDSPTRPKLVNIQSSVNSRTAATGLITGRLAYPSEYIPSLTIFAVRIDNQQGTFYSTQTSTNQDSYAIRVDPGVYQVMAYHGDFAGGYTKFATCNLGSDCREHTLLPVVLEAGDIVSDIDLLDWYAPVGTFPPRPDHSSFSRTSPVCSTYHTVRWGESLFRIGMQYNLTWKPIADANEISDPDLIYAGQVLCIPKSTSTSSVKDQPSSIPTIEILSVVKDKRVTIQTENYPANKTFVVTMGKYGTKGINGFQVAETQSGGGGSFTATYSIPNALRGESQIAIRLQSSSGYYSYNWFYNNSTE